MRRVRATLQIRALMVGLAASLLIGATLLSACGSTSTVPAKAVIMPTGQVGVPVSADPPIAFAHRIHAPSETREKPLGRLAFVVDSGSQSVYEFDFGRGRFLGPAPRVQTVDHGSLHTIALPGYPTVIGHQPPQQAARWHDHLFIAGGLDGTVVDIPILADGLGKPVPISIPPAQMVRPDGTLGTDASVETGQPFVAMLAVTADGRVLAIVKPHHMNTSVAYLVDGATHQVLATHQLPHGAAVSVAESGHTFLVAGDDGHLLQLRTADLEVVQDTAIANSVSGMASAGASSVILSLDEATPHATTGAATLVRVDLSTGRAALLASASTPFAGAVVSTPVGVWWALPDAGTVRLIQSGGQTRDLTICRSISDIAVDASQLIATCVGSRVLAVVDTSTGRSTMQPAGGFPFAVVLGP